MKNNKSTNKISYFVFFNIQQHKNNDDDDDSIF